MNTFIPIKINNDESIILSEILKLPSEFILERKFIACVDKFEVDDNKLFLVHYNQNRIDELISLIGSDEIFSKENVDKILSYRGYIINLKTEKIVCKSYGHTVNIQIDLIPNLPFYLEDLDKVIDPLELEYKIHYGGTLIRIWNLDGVNMFSTHKKIDASKSHWESSETFLTLFERNQDSYKLQEIPIEKDTVSIFLINDNSLLIDTRNRISNKIVYLETISLIDLELNFELTNEMIVKINNTRVYMWSNTISFPEVVTYEMANSWLQNGLINSKDNLSLNLWRGGEKILVSYKGEKYTFMSSSANWRKNIMDGKINVYQIFCKLLKSAYDMNNDISSRDNLNLIPTGFGITQLKIFKEFMDENDKLPDDFYDNFYEDQSEKFSSNPLDIAITNLFFAVPSNKLDEVIKIFYSFDDDLIKSANFLFSHKQEIKDLLSKREIEKFPSLHNKKTVSTCISKNWKLFSFAIKPEFSAIKNEEYLQWPRNFSNLYYELYIKWKSAKKEKNEIVIEAQLMEFMMTLSGELLFSMLSLPNNYQKTINAWERTKK